MVVLVEIMILGRVAFVVMPVVVEDLVMLLEML
jgi:hypothetical protein